MRRYQSAEPDARPFATAPYTVGQRQPEPSVLPWCCLWAQSEAGSCQIVVHHRRERKTGPEFAVVVLRCRIHRRAFTLYPLGQVPYGRMAVAPVSCDGELLHSAQAPGEPTAGPCWQTTLFVAALQAASAVAWPRESTGRSPLWDTQQAMLQKSARLLGLFPQSPPRVGEQIAQRLDLPRLVLMEAARAFEQAPGYKERGRAIKEVLQRLLPGRCLLEQILDCGALTGLWGPVQRWETGKSAGCSAVFWEVGTPRD
jgi:hypothetical protein